MGKWLGVVPPPLLFVVPLLAGFRLHRLCPFPLVPAAYVDTAKLMGWLVVVLGVAIVLSAVAMFIRRRTTIVPHHRARSLVAGGPFGFSRNPMYVGLCTIYLGVSLLIGSGWSVLLFAIPLVVLQAITIPMEERIMAEVFGDEYRAYASQVRRWL